MTVEHMTKIENEIQKQLENRKRKKNKGREIMKGLQRIYINRKWEERGRKFVKND